jgi:hypothetical protein
MTTPKKQHWKFTKEISAKSEGRGKKKYRNDIVHEPAEIQFQPYKHKPTAVETWLGHSEDDDKESA